MMARRIFYTGRVQGVGFRYSTRRIAAGFDVTGTVRNLPDGRVELFLQGERGEVEAMLEAVGASELKGFIKERVVLEEPAVPHLRGFEILK
jgi:acylphosphatase